MSEKETANSCPECGGELTDISGPGSREDDYEIVAVYCEECGYEVTT